ncbi:MAG: ABC transporter permease [Thermoleophilaceae bacterium]
MTGAVAGVGQPIRGPSALGGDLRRMLHLTVTLAVMEFKLRFFGSVLGYLWQLMRPLMLFGVLYLVFTKFVRVGAGVPHYQAILLTGIVMFTFFSEATGGAVTSVEGYENLVRKIEFPRLVVPLSVLLTAYFNLALNMIAVLVFVIASGVSPQAEWLLFPLLLLALGVFAAGLAMLLSALYVRFRDVKPIWEVATQVIFYGSPILYVLDIVPSANLQKLIATFNPLATILVEARHVLIDPSAPHAWDAAGGVSHLVVPAAIVLGTLVLGFWVFNREAPRIAEEL